MNEPGGSQSLNKAAVETGGRPGEMNVEGKEGAGRGTEGTGKAEGQTILYERAYT